MDNKVSKRASFIQILIFCLFIAGIFIANLAIPSRDFSERENRYLQTLPALSLKDLASGAFTKNFENYVMDQFVLRDSWTEMKARAELSLGKRENNDVYLASDGTLIERYEKPDYKMVDANIAAVNRLAETAGVPVYFALVPGVPEIWRGKLPSDAPNYSQAELISYIYEKAQPATIDMHSALDAHASEYIFYKTDHHWTTLGAYYGYEKLAGSLGLSPSPLSSYARRTVSDEFYGTVYSSSGFAWVEPDSIEIFVEPGENIEVTNFPTGSSMEGKLYDESFLEKKDKYSMFMGGNTPKLQIMTGNPGGKILILRDSFMDSLTPFLLEHYSEIHLLDLRYYILSVHDYIEQNDIDTVLVCYSVSNFASDVKVYLAGQ